MSELLVESRFLPTGYYIRIWDPETKAYCFYRLTEREGPLRYPITFEKRETTKVDEDTPPGEYAETIVFDELDPQETPVEHIYQTFLGVGRGALFHIYQPYQKKILEWDTVPGGPTTKVPGLPAREITASIDYNISPYDYPRFELWITPNRYPGIQPYVTAAKAITPKAIFYAMKYGFIRITEEEQPDLLPKLEELKIPSHPVMLGEVE